MRRTSPAKSTAKLIAILLLLLVPSAPATRAQTPPPKSAPASRNAAAKPTSKPKLIVLLVVDQMRADYVDKFRANWTGGLKRLLDEGAWFRAAAYHYSATETCVGHSTISTGAFPATHGMIANAWFDRETQKPVTCTADPKAKNSAYAGGTAKGGDSAARMAVPAFAEELKFQTGGASRVVTFSLKARSAITMAGHKGDAVTWFDNGAWTTSNVYGALPFVEDYAKAHPASQDIGKTWSLSLPENAYLYDEKAVGAVAPDGWDLTFPHSVRGKTGSGTLDPEFYGQWACSPFADTYLTRFAENAVDALGLGKSGATDFLGISYSSVDYVGHAFGPRSREIQDVLFRLDQDLGDLFAHLDKKVGRGNYVVALSADHGVVPVPEDMQKTGTDAGVLHLSELQDYLEKALQALDYPKPAVASVNGSDIYFSPGVYDRLKNDTAAMKSVLDAILAQPGVAGVYRAEEVADRPATANPLRRAFADNYFPRRSGDLFIVPKPYWLMDWTAAGQSRHYGTGHGTPYNYDQHVPILLMGAGIRHGEYFREVTPADIAPTLAALTGVTLAPRDGHILQEALEQAGPSAVAKPAAQPQPAPANP